MKIRVLPDRVANQIAAGEVVERPAAAVKELVENALDAGASRVEIEFRHGGQELIRVDDNGEGMVRDDALLALERHATSKIAEAADLERLHSFGFRGEALPSIASVARFTLRTRTAADASGTEIAVNAGKIWHVKDCGRPQGTSIVVEHLFHPVPARRKFLKSEATESAQIVQVVRLYALAFPAVAFSLLQDGRMIFQSPRGQTLDDRVGEIFGPEVAAGLLPITAEDDVLGWKLTGLVGAPGRGRPSRHEMIAYVNRRPVDSRTIAFALMEGFRESLPEGRYPIAFVFLEGDPSKVDVNVHPAKREVRFRDDQRVRSFIVRAVLSTLRDAARGIAAAIPPQAPPLLPEALRILGGGDADAGDAVTDAASEKGRVAEAEAPPASKPGAAPSFAHWRWLGLAQQYALFDTGAGLALLDRRAAQERVMYEDLAAQFQRGPVVSQRLLLPVPLDLDPVTSALLIDARDFLEAHGFAIADFGRHFFRVEAVPAWMEPADAEPLLRDILAALRDGRLDARDAGFAREQLALLASNRAGATPPAAGEAAVRALLQRLFATQLPLTTPSAKATLIELSWNEVARKFQR